MVMIAFFRGLESREEKTSRFFRSEGVIFTLPVETKVGSFDFLVAYF